jgi:hypothetical protein
MFRLELPREGMQMKNAPEFFVVTHSLFFLETRHKFLIDVRVTVALIIADLLGFDTIQHAQNTCKQCAIYSKVSQGV